MNSTKKLLFKVILFCIVLTGIAFSPQKASASGEDFVIEDGVLIKYKGSGGDVVIPNNVRFIGEDAFWHYYSLHSITIPNSVTGIGVSAFWGCKNLTDVTISDSVIEIGNFAFSNCSNLTNITIPNSVKKIGMQAFAACNNLTSITIPSSVINLEISAFYYCENLKELESEKFSLIQKKITSPVTSYMVSLIKLTNS